MAVVSVKDLFAGASGAVGTGRYTRTLRVRTNSSTDGPLTVTRDPRVPQSGYYYQYRNEADLTSFAEEPLAKQLGPFQWEVTVSYKPQSRNSNKPKDPQNPTNEATKRSGSGYSVDTFPVKDLDGKPFANSAGHPYDAIAVPTAIGTYRCTYNRQSWTIDQTRQYLNTVNGSTFKGYPARSLKIASIDWEELVSDKGVPYVRLTVEVHQHPETWDTEVLDKGPYWLEDDLEGENPNADENGKVKTYTTDKDGVKSMVDVFLDGKGGRGDATNPQFKKFKTLKTSNFSAIVR